MFTDVSLTITLGLSTRPEPARPRLMALMLFCPWALMEQSPLEEIEVSLMLTSWEELTTFTATVPPREEGFVPAATATVAAMPRIWEESVARTSTGPLTTFFFALVFDPLMVVVTSLSMTLTAIEALLALASPSPPMAIATDPVMLSIWAMESASTSSPPLVPVCVTSESISSAETSLAITFTATAAPAWDPLLTPICPAMDRMRLPCSAPPFMM